MSIVARQSTALETAIGPVLDADGVAVTNCVVGDFKIKKTTGNFAALNGSATLTHVSAGIYDLVLTTSDTDTIGLCCIAIDDTVNACQPIYLQVVVAEVYDDLFGSSAVGYLKPATAGRDLVVDASGIADANIEKVDNDADAAVGMYQIGTLQFNYDHINTEANILSVGISSVTSQTIFVLDGGVATDDYYNGMLGTIQSANTPDRHYFRVVDYVGSTNTLTIDAAAPFTVNATNHEVNIIATPKQTIALPTATAGASGGVFIAGTNAATSITTALTANITGNLSGSVGSVTGAVGSVTGNVGGNVTGSVGSVTGAVGSVTGNVGGNVVGSVASVTGAVGSVTGAVGSVTGNVGGNVVGSVASVTGAVGSVTGNVGGNVVGSVASVTGGINTAAGTIQTLDALDTAQDTQHSTTQTYLSTNLGLLGANATEAGGTGDQLTAIPWNAAWDAEVQSECVDAIQETVPDSIPADGTRPSLQQAAYMLTQFFTDFAISGTTYTVKKVDGSTTLFTLTLNDGTSPTGITRAT